MKIVLLSALCFTAFSASVRSAQSVSANIDVNFPVELAIQLFGPAVDTLTQSLETTLLQTLYPDTFADVQGQLDTCETNFWNTQVTDLQTINADLWGLATACTSDDPSAPVNKLMQDTLALMATFSLNCDGLSVNLIGDINNFIAGLLVQGVQFTTPFTGPLTQWTAASLVPLEQLPTYLTQLTGSLGSVATTFGITQDTVDQTNTDINAEIAAGNQILNDFANTGATTQADVAAALNAALTLVNDGNTMGAQVLQGSGALITQAMQAVCSFAGPLLSFATPAAAPASDAATS